jgi:CMP-N,N'-diacetyllegionaminic acid synthase
MGSGVIGLITARGGSKGIPHKNIKVLAGKPLIAWTIEAAVQSQQLDRVVVSTDDEEIAHVASEWGAQVPFIRPAELARDDSSHISVVIHAIEWLKSNEHFEPAYLMLLQPTSPLRTAQDIDTAIELAMTRNAVAVVGVCEAKHHPSLCKRVLDDGTLGDLVPSNLAYDRRQDLPHVYAVNGAIYVNQRQSLLRDRTFFPAGTYPYVMPAERSLDIDTPWDLHLADLILRDRDEFQAA